MRSRVHDDTLRATRNATLCELVVWRERIRLGYNAPMECTVKGIVRYDGTNFVGWQVQPNQPTVQGKIEQALATIAQQPIRVLGSGRTDAGVHALAQVFSFKWPAESPPDSLRRSLTKMLGPEISIEEIEQAPDDFHPIYAAKSKYYTYVFSTKSEADPFISRYAWSPIWPMDRARFGELAQRVVGEHDFAGFCSSGSSVEDTVRTIHSVKVADGGVIQPCDRADLWQVTFHGNGFLYKMVRNIVGTLADVTRGHVPEEELEKRLTAPAPFKGFTAPAHGLFLARVCY